MKYQINVNDTPEKEDYMVVVIIDDKTKTTASFALSKTEKIGKATQLIKSAIYKVNQWKPTKQTTKSKSKNSPKKNALKKLNNPAKKL